MNTRKLVLIEYDENGNEVDRNVVAENQDLLKVHGAYDKLIKDRYLLDKHEREFYTSRQWDIMERVGVDGLIGYYAKEKGEYGGFNNFHHAEIIEERKLFWDAFFKEPIEKQEYILSLFHSLCGDWVRLNGEVLYNSANLKSCWDWVNKTAGEYQYVDNRGEVRSSCYIEEKPTRKQAAYQRKKYGVRLVFCSFKDWKKYEVNESELS